MSSVRLSRQRLVLATVPLLLLLVGCAGEAGDVTGAPAAAGQDPAAGGAAGMCPVGTTDCVDADLGAADDPMVAPDIHLVDALPADIRMVEPAPGTAQEPWPVFVQEAVVDGTRMDLVFGGGRAPCFFVDRVEVTEDDAEVVVAVLAGGGPVDGGDCGVEETSVQAVTVELAAPLGDRALLDASRVVPTE